MSLRCEWWGGADGARGGAKWGLPIRRSDETVSIHIDFVFLNDEAWGTVVGTKRRRYI